MSQTKWHPDKEYMYVWIQIYTGMGGLMIPPATTTECHHTYTVFRSIHNKKVLTIGHVERFI